MSTPIPTVTPFYDAATSTFSYVVVDPTTSVAAIIDPVLDYNPVTRARSTHSARKLLDFVVLHGLKVQWILETHAHADHLSSAQWLKGQLGGQPRVGIGARIREVQEAFKVRLSLEPDFRADGSQFDALFNDGEKLLLGSIPLEVIATPGHTPDSVTYLIGDAAFVGDTLFAPRYGTARCDFPGGDARQLFRSLRRILSLPATTRLFMCHDYLPAGRTEYVWETTVEAERSGNIHAHDGITEDEFVAMREARDATLDMPRLILPSVQVNMRAGHMPAADDNGITYLKIPVNAV